MPKAPSWTAATAATPKRVASTRSKAVGVPPRWTCPSVVTRASKPVRCSISIGQPGPDPAQPGVTEGVDRRARRGRPGRLGVGAVGRDGPLGDDHDGRELTAGVPPPQPLAHGVEIERDLRHQDLGRPAGHPGVGGDPAGVPPHHLADDDPVVRFGRRPQPVDGVGGDLHGRVETEGDLGPGQIVVDRLRHAHHRHPVTAQPVGHAQGVLAPDGHQGVDPVGGQGGHHPLGAPVAGRRDWSATSPGWSPRAA